MSKIWTNVVALSRAVIVIGCIVHSPKLPALFLVPPDPDPWYSLWVQIEARSLPPGVDFKLVDIPERTIGFFTNSSSTPFYLVISPASPPKWVNDLPRNVVPKQMAVRGAAYRMDLTRNWSRENFPGLLFERYVKYPSGDGPGAVRMVAYQGGRKIEITGLSFRERGRPIELDAPLPALLRLAEVRVGRGRYMLVNDGPVPLYTGSTFSGPVGWVEEMPPGLLATHKIVAGKTYVGERLFVTTTDGWKRTEPWDARLTIRQFRQYMPGFELKQVSRDNRPADITIPDPQPFEMTALYGKQRIVIRGRVLYDLNLNYNPLASEGKPVCLSCTGSMCDECVNNRSSPNPALKPPIYPPTY